MALPPEAKNHVTVSHEVSLDKTKDVVETVVHRLSTTSSDTEPATPVPHQDFEGRHLFDPQAIWTPDEEARVRWKTDLRLLGWLCVMLFGMQLGRSNLANALSDNFLGDLGFTERDYAHGLTIYKLSALVAAFPGQIIVLRFGSRHFMPILMTMWSTVCWSQSFMGTRAAFYATRSLLGLLEGAFAPTPALLLSHFHTSREMGLRLACLGAALHTSRSLSTLVAAGLLRMRGLHGEPGWFWMFLIDGLVALLIAFASFFFVPGSPVRTEGLLWTKPWFTEREQVIMVNRLLRDDPSKGQTATKINTKFRDIWRALKDPALIGLWVLGVVGFIAANPIQQYLPWFLKKVLGFSVFKSNVLTIPADIIHATFLLLLAWSSSKFKERTFHCVFAEFYCVPFLAVLVALPAYGHQWTRYTISILITGAPNCYPIVLSWVSENSHDVKKRGLAIVILGVLEQFGNVASTQIYQKEDGLYHYTGNKILIGICGVAVLVLLVQRKVLERLNKRKEVEDRERSLAGINDGGNAGANAANNSGNKSLGLKFSY